MSESHFLSHFSTRVSCEVPQALSVSYIFSIGISFLSKINIKIGPDDRTIVHLSGQFLGTEAEATRDPTPTTYVGKSVPAPKAFDEPETGPNCAIGTEGERAIPPIPTPIPSEPGSSGSEIFRETDSDEVE